MPKALAPFCIVISVYTGLGLSDGRLRLLSVVISSLLVGI